MTTVVSCNTCGNTTSSLMNCKRCKLVAYCSAKCQRRDWKDHKPTCPGKEFAGAPCDCCGTTENVQGGHMCLDCGFLFCEVCHKQSLSRDLLGEVVFAPCPRCHKKRDSFCFRDHKKLEKLIKESPRDPRLANWFVHLGSIFAHFGDTPWVELKAKQHYLRAGELGYGEGFSRVAEIHIKNQNWVEARRYYRMAADKFHVVAIANLASEAGMGYFQFGSGFRFGEIIQEDQRRPPDLEEAVCLYREGARLGHAGCCGRLGRCYLHGIGTEQDFAKAFKWSKKAADKGDANCMNKCAHCYLFGKGVEQSNEQAIYWYEKYLELEEDESARNNLQTLHGLGIGSS